MTSVTPTVGQKIRRAREARPLTQKELAKRVGVSRMALSDWEHDRTLPRLASARKLAEILGMPESDLTPLGASEQSAVSFEYQRPSECSDCNEALQLIEQLVDALENERDLNGIHLKITLFDGRRRKRRKKSDK